MLKYFNDGISFEYIYLCVSPSGCTRGCSPTPWFFWTHHLDRCSSWGTVPPVKNEAFPIKKRSYTPPPPPSPNSPSLYWKMNESFFRIEISDLQFADWLCLFTDHFKQFLVEFSNQKLLLESLSSGKPQSFCLHFKLATFLHI